MMSRLASMVWAHWEQYGICTPLDAIDAARQLGFSVYSYIEGKGLLDKLNIPESALEMPAFSSRHDGQPCIFYAAGLPAYHRNHAIWHEIGHCVAGHENIGSIVFGDTSNEELRKQQEAEAEEFALEAVPTPVLSEAGLKTHKDIQRITRLDDDAVKHIVERVADYAYNPLDPEERRICNQYRDFIRQNKRVAVKQMRHRQITVAIALAIALVLSTVCITVSLMTVIQQQAPVTSVAPTTAPAITSEVSALPQGQIVYWTDSGDVYHIDRNCQHIRNRTNVRSGTVAESGKGRVCKTCG